MEKYMAKITCLISLLREKEREEFKLKIKVWAIRQLWPKHKSRWENSNWLFEINIEEKNIYQISSKKIKYIERDFSNVEDSSFS